MTDYDRFFSDNRTLCTFIRQNPLLSGCIRNVHYPVKSGNFVQRVEKNRTERDILFRFLVEVTGFEPATFWSRNPNECSILSAPDRKRRAFPSLFCLRRTGGDRFGCRIVASIWGMQLCIFARIGSDKCTWDQRLQRIIRHSPQNSPPAPSPSGTPPGYTAADNRSLSNKP